MHKTMSVQNIQRTPLTDRVLTGVGAIESMSWKGCSLESLEVLFACKERWWKICSSLACSGPRWKLSRRGVFEWEKFDVVTRGEKLACWQMACSTCADVFVHVDQVALDPVCKLSELLWNELSATLELSGHSGWYDRRCPRWRAGDVAPLTLLMFVASSFEQMWCEMLWFQHDLGVDAAERWLPNCCLSNSLDAGVDWRPLIEGCERW